MFSGFLSLLYKPQEVLCARDYQKFPSIEAALVCISYKVSWRHHDTCWHLCCRSFVTFVQILWSAGSNVFIFWARSQRNLLQECASWIRHVCPDVTSLEPQNRFSWQFISRSFSKLHGHRPILVKIGQQQLGLNMIYMRICSHLECNSLSIYRGETCFKSCTEK